ncbi:hypothetical protein CAL7716_043790 [Calothrix sp. PCC 7716]|nr:hypothetical protein CAL7716_043790 [Calothrix sp. PCC 7716]
MPKQSIQEKLQASFSQTKSLYQFNIKAGWFYVKISATANVILIAGTDMAEVSGIIRDKNDVAELAMLEKDIYLFGRATAIDEKEKPTCYHKNLPCYGDIFVAFKDGKKIHPIPFENAIKNIEKLQFAKKSDKTIHVTMV